MKAIIKKELLEGSRTYKFLIILIVFMFFAILNPVMNKLILPEILKSQFAGMSEDMMSQMVVTSQRECVRGYLSDVFEIGTLVVVLSLASLIAGELRNRTFIFPVCSRKDFDILVISKLAVYGSVTMVVSVAAVLADYLYAGVLFGFDLPGVIPIIRSGLLQGLYFVYVIALVMTAGAFVRKPITAGLIALIPAYGTQILSSLFNIDTYTPAGLMSEATLMAVKVNPEIYKTVGITLAAIIVLTIITIVRLNSIELARRT